MIYPLSIGSTDGDTFINCVDFVTPGSGTIDMVVAGSSFSEDLTG
jgi:hypothetical protein